MRDPSTATVAQPSDLRAESVERRAFRLTVVIAGVFALMIWLAMVLAQIDARPTDLLKPEQIQAAKERLQLSPNDEQLKAQIRELDLQLRRAYFRQLSLTNRGSFLLLAGVVVFLLAAKRIVALDRKPPMPSVKPDVPQSTARVSTLARWSVAALGAMAVAGLLSLTLTIGTVLPTRPGDLAASDLPSPEEMNRNWPRFRGPDGDAISKQTDTPLKWDEATGQGVLWKVPVPAPGFNSPIVWGQRVFLSGGDAARRAVYCFDAGNGKSLWERPVQNVPGSLAQAPEIPEYTGLAASTMATDGRRVYVMFANGDLAAFTLEGNPVWSQNLGVPKNSHGHASSLATWQGRLLVQLDQGEAEQHLSKLFAFDGSSGKILWERQRPVGSSWTTPIVITVAGKPQIVTVGIPFVIAYAPSDGTEIWRIEGMINEVTPSPVLAGGFVLAISPSANLMAVRPDGQGDVTKTHIAWNSEENVPDVTSPVSNGDLVFTVTSGGFLTCHDAKDGKKLWEHDYDADCHASPSIASGRLYLIFTNGVVAVVETSRQYKELARMQMADSFKASPAFASGRILLRGATNLYCLGAAEQKASDLPSPEEMNRNWPRFRGPDGNGLSMQTNTPLTWDAATGRGVVWKIAVPAPGFNSPIVWGQRVFLSGGDAARRAVFCLDAGNGKNLWERPVQNVPGSPVKAPEIQESTGFAASTMATDGRRIYVIFANGDLAAFTLEGNPIWSKHLGVPKNPYGHASSLATWQGRLLVQLDQGEAEQKQSKLFAFDGSSGEILWQRQRPVGSSWTTPIVITAAGTPQIITVGLPFIIAYAPTDGTELWRVEGMNGEVTPSAVFAGGFVLAISPTEKLMAIRPDGQGDVTKTHIAWNSEEGIPDVTSPVSNGDLVFTVNSGGFLTCHDAKDGKKHWEHDYETDFHASPSIVGDRLYLIGGKGVVSVVETARQYKELARMQMADAFFASPAFANGRIFLRGTTNLYCLGATEQKLASQ